MKDQFCQRMRNLILIREYLSFVKTSEIIGNKMTLLSQ